MKKSIVKLDRKGLTQFGHTLDLANQMLAEGEHKTADYFDTPAKRLQWWLDLDPQWRWAFNEAVFQHKKLEDAANYQPTDEELQFLFDLKELFVCGSGAFRRRNNFPDISFQLNNLSGVKNLTNLRRLECDFNGQIESLEPVRHLTNLQEFWFDNNRVSDLSPLMELSNLTGISCWNNKIKSIEPLASLINLSNLCIGLYDQGNPLESIDPLKYLGNLRVLDLNNCGITSLEPLRYCHKLRYLRAAHNDIESLEPIQHLDLIYREFENNPRLGKSG